jgi:hypothetical protein
VGHPAWSTAASTLGLRAFEYGSMPAVSHADQSTRKPLSDARRFSATLSRSTRAFSHREEEARLSAEVGRKSHAPA